MTSLRRLLRRLARHPAYSATAVLTLALGIAANVAIFGVVNGVLLEPLPYPEPERLVSVWQTAPGIGFPRVDQSAATYFTYRDDAASFTDIGLWRPDSASVTGLAEPEEVPVLQVTDGTLPLLGARPFLGRIFVAADDLPDSPRVVMVSHAYWQRRLGGSADAVGTSLRIDGESWEIVGVLPPGFSIGDQTADLFVPMRFDRSRVVMGQFNYRGLARLAPGVTTEQAVAEMNRLVPVAVERFPGGLALSMLEEARFGSEVFPFVEDVVGDVGDSLWVLLGTVGLVLVIACANVANLFLVRAEGRHREMALREALGAGRLGVVRELLGESVALGLVGGAVGVGLAWAALRALVAVAPSGLPRLGEIGVGPTVLVFALGVSLLAGVAFGLAPAVRLARSDLSLGLRDGARAGTVGRGGSRLRSLLVVAQVALALVLLVSSGLLVRSFAALRDVDPGFRDPESLLTFRLSLPRAEIADEQEAALLMQRIVEGVEALPGVVSAAAVSSLPMEGLASSDALAIEDFPAEEGQLPPIRRYKFVAGDYAGTMGQRLVAGRSIEWADAVERRRVVAVSEEMAREVWGSPEAALGRRVSDLAPQGDGKMVPTSWKTIVGVIGDVRDDGVDQPTFPTVYWPYVVPDHWGEDEFVVRSLSIVLRAEEGLRPGSLLPAVERVVWAENPNLPLASVRTMQQVLDRSRARTSFTLTMLAIAAAMAVSLGSVGLYGVISYLVTQRTREIGVRMALGARRRSVSAMMIRHGMVLAGAGVVVGLLAAAGVTRLLESLLFGVAAIDPVTYVAVSAGLAAVALAANVLASLRAASVDPIRALRAE
ncbi:MAG: ABC transporter permease [Thermoanaerobaculia bacterium]|nr:ABC transporter permease [Thermoanaerobaculia bacterium]